LLKNVYVLTNLKIARIKKGLKQKELAALLSVSDKTISNYEAGVREPDVKTLIKLAQILNVSTDYLIGIEQKTLVEQVKDHIHDLDREELIALVNDYLEVIEKIKQ